MRPTSASDDMTNRLGVNAVLTCEIRRRRPKLGNPTAAAPRYIDSANSENVVLRESSAAVRFARAIRSTARPSMLRHGVSRVVALAAEKEMRRVHAGRVVASMQHERPSGYRPVGEHPRASMSEVLRTAKSAVAASIAGARPEPACIRRCRDEVANESFFPVDRHAIDVTSLFCGIGGS